jgi:hypothetical protein
MISKNLDKLPEQIKAEKKWVFYGLNKKTGSDKCPFILDRVSCKVFALSTNKKYFRMENFLSFNEAKCILAKIIAKKVEVYNGAIRGIGYYFLDSNYSCIDLDNCFFDDTRTLRNSFKKLLSDCKDTYIEYSKSGRGLHILVENDIFLDKFEFKLENLKDAYSRSVIDMDEDLQTNGKPPGIDYLCDKKFIALTGELYSSTCNINYKTSDFKRFYDRFKKFYKREDSKILNLKKEAKKASVSVQNYTSNTNIFSRIKDRLTLADVISYYSSPTLVDGNHHNCPLHGGQSNSFQYLSHLDKYICYSPNCISKTNQNGNRTGDLFDYTMYVNGLNSVKESAVILIEDFDLRLT